MNYSDRRVWTIEEDEQLVGLVQKHGNKQWTKIGKCLSDKFRDINRNGKQCRQRWCNHLNPLIKKKDWNEEEQKEFVSRWIQMGNKWTKIAELMEGRTESSIKNFFYSNIRRAIRTINSQLQETQDRFKPLSAEQFYKINQQSADHKLVSQVINLLLKIGYLKYQQKSKAIINQQIQRALFLIPKLIPKQNSISKIEDVQQQSLQKSQIDMSRILQDTDAVKQPCKARFRKVESVEIKRSQYDMLLQCPESEAAQSPNCSTPSSFYKILSLNNSQMRGNMLNMQLMQVSGVMNWPMSFNKEQ